MSRIGEHDIALDRRQLVGDLFQERHESDVGEHHPVTGVIDDPGDLIGKQSRIDRVVDRAETEDAVPDFQMPPGIPRERRHAVAELDAVLLQPLRHLERARADFGIVGRVDRTFDRACDDLALAMVDGGMVDDAMAQQRPILHQAEHGIPLSVRRAVEPENFSGLMRVIRLGPAPLASRVKVSHRAGPCNGFV